MDQVATKVVSDHEIEVIPPTRDKRNAQNTTICLCCQKKRLASRMDVDGCGICEECLAP
jgi:hypothetical protein